MRHGLPHARRIGRGMLLLLLPLRAFGHSRTGKFVDRAVAAGTLENPIAAGIDHSPHLAGARHIFPTVPAFHSASTSAGTDMRPICNTGAMPRSGISMPSG